MIKHLLKEIPYDEAKALLIQHYGDVNKVIHVFLKDFKFNGHNQFKNQFE